MGGVYVKTRKGIHGNKRITITQVVTIGHCYQLLLNVNSKYFE